VNTDAPEGSYDLVNTNLIASTADGTRLPVNGGSCHIVVAVPTATPTPTPRCRTNDDCPSGEVCVDGTCVTATPTRTPPGFCNDDNDCPEGQVCVDHHCVTPTPTPQCHQDEDCPSGQVCVDGTCVTATPTVTPTNTSKPKGNGGGGCSCEIDPGAPLARTSDVLAVLLPALVLLLRWRARRAHR
jgi:MYXO-CTERM domain-containing protein